MKRIVISTVIAALVAVSAAPAMAGGFWVNQSGYGNSTGGKQTGWNNSYSIQQTGRYNSQVGQQWGNNNVGAVGQEGRNNSADTWQNENHRR